MSFGPTQRVRLPPPRSYNVVVTNQPRVDDCVDIKDVGGGLFHLSVKGPLPGAKHRAVSRAVHGTKPWAMLKVAESHKVDPVLQAVLWTARPTLIGLARKRILATRALGTGKNKVWRKILFNLKDLCNALSKKSHKNDLVRYVIYRYIKWCINEIQSAYKVRTYRFGIYDAELRLYDQVEKPKPRLLLRGCKICQRHNLRAHSPICFIET